MKRNSNILLSHTHDQLMGDETNSVAMMSRQIHCQLQNTTIAEIKLSVGHLLQFLDWGEQLAFHDILPIFVNISAIYLNVFNPYRG